MSLVVKLDQDLCRATTWSDYDDLRKRLKQLVDPVVELIREYGTFETTWRIRAWLNVLVRRKEWLLNTDQYKLDLAVFRRAPFLQGSDKDSNSFDEEEESFDSDAEVSYNDKEEDFDSDEEEDFDKAKDVIMKLGTLLSIDYGSDMDQDEAEGSDGMVDDKEEEDGGSDEQEGMEVDEHRNSEVSKVNGKKRKAPSISGTSDSDDDDYTSPVQVKRAKVGSQAKATTAPRRAQGSPAPLQTPCERCRLLRHECLQVKAKQACTRCRKDKRPCTFSAKRGVRPATSPAEPEPTKSTTVGKGKRGSAASGKTTASAVSRPAAVDPETPTSIVPRKGRQPSPVSEKRASVSGARFVVAEPASTSTPSKKGTQGSTVLKKAVNLKVSDAVKKPETKTSTRQTQGPTLPTNDGAPAADPLAPESVSFQSQLGSSLLILEKEKERPMSISVPVVPPRLTASSTLSGRSGQGRNTDETSDTPRPTAASATPSLAVHPRLVISSAPRGGSRSSALYERQATAAVESRSATSGLSVQRPGPTLPATAPVSASTKSWSLTPLSFRKRRSLLDLFGEQSRSNRPQAASESVAEAGETLQPTTSVPPTPIPSHERQKQASLRVATPAAVAEKGPQAATATAAPQRSVATDPGRTASNSTASTSQEKQVPNERAAPAVPQRIVTVESDSQASANGALGNAARNPSTTSGAGATPTSNIDEIVRRIFKGCIAPGFQESSTTRGGSQTNEESQSVGRTGNMDTERSIGNATELAISSAANETEPRPTTSSATLGQGSRGSAVIEKDLQGATAIAAPQQSESRRTPASTSSTSQEKQVPTDRVQDTRAMPQRTVTVESGLQASLRNGALGSVAPSPAPTAAPSDAELGEIRVMGGIRFRVVENLPDVKAASSRSKAGSQSAGKATNAATERSIGSTTGHGLGDGSKASTSQEKQAPNRERTVSTTPQRTATESESRASLRNGDLEAVASSPLFTPTVPSGAGTSEGSRIAAAGKESSTNTSCSDQANAGSRSAAKTTSAATERNIGGRAGKGMDRDGSVGINASGNVLENGRDHTEEIRRLEARVRQLEAENQRKETRLQKLERDVLGLQVSLAASKRGPEREPPPIPTTHIEQEIVSRIEGMTNRLEDYIYEIIAEQTRALTSLVVQHLTPINTPTNSIPQAQPPTI